jgi:hypothetical protein
LAVRVSTVLARLAPMVARSAAMGSAMVDVTDGVGDGLVGLSGGVVEDEECLVFDTRLSRPPGDRVAGPWLRNS